MRAAALDKRVKKEATLLVRAARGALALKRSLRGKAGDLQTVTDEMADALNAKDYARVRRGLPALDGLVDELIKAPSKSTTRDYVESIGAAILIALALRAFVIEAFKIPSASMYPTLEIGDHIFVNKFLYGLRIPYTSTKLFELRGPKRGEVIVFMMPCNTERDYIKRVVATGGDTVEVRCNQVYVNGLANPQKQLTDKCEYEDFGDTPGRTPLGWFKSPCSLFEESALGVPYQTYQDEGYPDRRAERAKGEAPHADGKDFPRLDERVLQTCSNVRDNEMVPAANQVEGKLFETAPANSLGPCDLQLHYVVPPNHVFVMGDNRANSNDSRYWGSVPVENVKGKALFIWLSYKSVPSEIRWSRIGDFVN